jgi:hypothetical protein
MKEISKQRQKRLDTKESDKDLISIWRKKIKLMNGKRSLNRIELEKPERWGYVRTFTLRDDIAKSKEADFYRGLLKLVQIEVFSRDKKFEYKDYKTKKKLPIDQQLGFITHKVWNKLIVDGKLTDKQKACFELRWKMNKYTRHGEWVFEFTKPWMFVYKVDIHYLTHRTVIDPQLESELRELENKIVNQNLMPKISKLMGWSNGWKDWKDMLNKLVEYGDQAAIKEFDTAINPWEKV